MKKNVTIKRTNKKISILLSICMLLAVCLGIPASASTRYHSSSYSTSSTRYETNITGFMGQSMLKARATKSGSGANSSVTGYVENLNITKYSLSVDLYCTVETSVWGERYTYSYRRTTSTQTGATSLNIKNTYQQYSEFMGATIASYPVVDSWSELYIASTCPYPYDLPYYDYISYPSFY